MEQEELHKARTDSEFLAYLEHREKEVLETKSISGLYEVLDTFLVLDIDESRINRVYEEILKVAFDKIEDRLKQNQKLTLEGDDIFFVRSFYEHAIEKWSMQNFDGAGELFFILTNIVDDKKLVDSITVHLLESSKSIDMDTFYDQKVKIDETSTDEKYGYFIMNYIFDTNEYLKENEKNITAQFEKLKHLLD